MKAVRISKPWEVNVVEVDEPRPSAGEALIKIVTAGICGSDIGAYRGTNSLVSYPRVIGHELAGTIVSVPENAAGLREGDRVVADPYLYCGSCYPCSLGRTNCCTSLRVLGVHVDGGMSEFFAHPADMLVKAPDDISWDLLPIAEPLTISLHGTHRLGLKAGEHIAIFGAGTIGLLAAQVAVHYGAVPIVIDMVEERLALAQKFGALTVNLKKQDTARAVSELTDGALCECVLEASGAGPAIRSCLDVVCNAGRVALTGWPKGETSLPTDVITKKEIDLRGSRVSAGEFPEAIELIRSGAVDVKAILTSVVPIGEAADAVRDIEKNPGSYLKVNVRM